jgi:hypothetical protein
MDQKALCALKVIGEAALKAVKFFMDCMGLDMAKCAVKVGEDIARCAGGGNCDIHFGYPDCLTISQDLSADQRRALKVPSFMHHGRKALNAPASPAKVQGIEYHPGPEAHMAHRHDNTWDLGVEHDGPRRGLRRKKVDGISTTGKLKVAGGFGITVNPKKGTSKFAVTVEATFDGKLKFEPSQANKVKTWEQKRAIGKQVQLFQKTMMVGKFPCVVTVTVQPYLWLEGKKEMAYTGEITLNKKEKVTGSITMDTNKKSLDPKITWDSTPPSFTVTSAGKFHAYFISRIGPKFKLSVNSVPVYFDAALALKANLEVNLNGACFDGSASVGASLDWRTNVKFKVDPVQAAYDACIAMVDFALSNPAVKMGQCLANTFGAGIDLKKSGHDICNNIQTDMFAEAKATVCYGKDEVLGDINTWKTIPLKSQKVSIGNLCAGQSLSQTAVKETTAGIMNGKCGSAPSSYGKFLMSAKYGGSASGAVSIAVPMFATFALALMNAITMLWV